MGIPLWRAWDRLTAGDPGLLRTTSALRAVAGIALTLALLALMDMPAAFLVAGCFAPFTVALAGGHSLARDQVFVVVAAVPLVSAVLLAGSALAPYSVAAEAFFVLLIFWSVYVRRYGPRGQALGIFAFMAYFLTQFLDARVGWLPNLYAAVGIGFAADALVGFGLLRTSPARTLRLLRRAFRTYLSPAPTALVDVHHAIGELMGATAGLRPIADGSYRAVDGGPAGRTGGGLRRVTTRQAFQVSAAAAIAVVGGELSSSERWYWAVLTAWVVFVNTESSGEILLQGFQRLLGTVLGVACGLSFAAVAGGDVPLALGLSLVCVFGVFRTAPHAYWVVTFFITCLIAMAFVLLGTFSAELLALRVRETAFGALCGVLAGALVLPTTVRRASGERLLKVLRALRRTRVPERGALLDAIELDRALEELRGSLRPLTHPLNPRRARRAHARHLLTLLESCAYHARSLAAVTGETGEAACADHASERIRANLDRVIHLVEAGAWPVIPCHDGRRTLARIAADPRWGGDGTSGAHRGHFHLDRLDEATAELAGLPARHGSGARHPSRSCRPSSPAGHAVGSGR
ncbi:FUSC family protein [Nonomuraea sp. NBC_00507]|uniref:FUSC family protein n=1 Tax=Nonomuraea sp. NBC_00507 TaxID=2976002 RepID=UPI002E18DE11